MLTKLVSYKYLIGLLILSFSVVFYAIAGHSFGLDEVFSITITKEFNTMSSILWTNESNMWLYYLILHYWRQIGISEITLRSLSAIFAALSIIPIYLIAKKLFDEKTAIITGILTTLNIYFVFRAQEVRSYPLLLLLLSFGIYAFLKFEEKLRYKIVFVVLSILSVYAHLYAVFTLLSLAVYKTWEELHFAKKPIVIGKNQVNYLLSFIVIGVSLLPIIVAPSFSSPQLDWIVKPDFLQLAITAYMLLGDMIPLFALYNLSFIILAYQLLTKQMNKNHFFVLTLAVVPVLTSYLYSLFIKPVFQPEYFIMCLPPLLMLTASALASFKYTNVTKFLFVSLIVFSTLRLGFWYTETSSNLFKGIIRNHTQDWRSAATYIDSHAQNEDVVIFYGYYSKFPYSFYDHNGPQVIEIASHNYSLGGGDTPPEPDLSLVKSLSNERVWFVVNQDSLEIFNGDTQYTEIVEALELKYQQVAIVDFYGVQEILFERKDI